MTIFLDTGMLVAWVDTNDARQGPAKATIDAVLAGTYGPGVVIDHVLQETFTFLRARLGRLDVTERLRDRLLTTADPFFQLRHTSLEDLRDAIELHIKHYDRRLSITDCALIVHANAARGVVATFDGGFKGIVPTVPG